MASSRTSVLLIDLDGTLLRSSPKRLKWAFLLTFLSESRRREIGVWKALRALHRMRRALEDSGVPRQSNRELAVRVFARETGLEPEAAEHLLIDMVRICFQRMKPLFEPIPEAVDFIRWAKERGYRLILATNPMWPEDIVKWRVGLAQIEWSDFSYHTTSDFMRACKPALRYYEELLQRQDLRAADCVMIGNDIRKDTPAAELGIEVFLVDQRRPWQGSSLVRSGSFDDLKKFLSERRA
jgi:FMN phosphatase YigB (HAD superfamily)